MRSTMSLFLGLEAFVDEAVRGRKVGHRATIEESMLDVVDTDAREIVYGLAFTLWSGARLRTFLSLAGRRYHRLFLRVMKKRVTELNATKAPEAAFELEAVSDLIDEFRSGHPELGAEVDQVVALCHHVPSIDNGATVSS